MVAFNYNKAYEVAKKLIEKFGGSGSFVVTGSTGGYDDDGNVIPDIPDRTISGTVTPMLQYKSMEIDGSTIQTGDSYIFADTSAEVPINAVITLNGDTFRVVNVQGITSVDGVKVYRKLQLRR